MRSGIPPAVFVPSFAPGGAGLFDACLLLELDEAVPGG